MTKIKYTKKEIHEIEIRALAGQIDELFASIIDDNDLNDYEINLLTDQLLYTFGIHYAEHSDKDLDEAVIEASYLIQDAVNDFASLEYTDRPNLRLIH